MVELFRACVLYELPMALLEFAQMELFELLPLNAPGVALEVFSVCTLSAAESRQSTLRPILNAATYLLLRSAPQAFRGIDPRATAAIFQKIAETVEHEIFHRADKSQQPPQRSVQEATHQQPLPPARVIARDQVEQQFPEMRSALGNLAHGLDQRQMLMLARHRAQGQMQHGQMPHGQMPLVQPRPAPDEARQSQPYPAAPGRGGYPAGSGQPVGFADVGRGAGGWQSYSRT